MSSIPRISSDSAAPIPSPAANTFDLSGVSESRRDMVKLLLAWNDPSVVKASQIELVHKWMDENIEFAASVYYRASDLQLTQYQDGPGVVDAEGWVHGWAGDKERPCKLKFNVLADQMSLVDDVQIRPPRTAAEQVKFLQELAEKEPEYARRVSSPESVLASIPDAFAKGGPAAMLGFIVPGSAVAIGKKAGLPFEEDLPVLERIAQNLAEAVKTIKLQATFRETTIAEGATRREYDIVTPDGQTSTQVFERYGKLWLVDIAA